MMNLMAVTLTLDPGLATLVAAAVLILFQLWNSFRIASIHVLVNSNFSEAKAARLAAEAALAIAQQRNTTLEKALTTSVDTAKQATQIAASATK